MADNTKDYLLAEIAKRLERCKAIVGAAEKEARDNTEDEQAEIRANMTRIEEHKVEVKRIEDREALSAQLEALGTVAHIASSEAVEVQAKSIGEALVRSPEFKALREAATAQGMPKFDLPAVELKAAGDPVLESTANNDDAIAPTWLSNLYAPGLVQFPLRVESLLSSAQVTNGNTVIYPIVTTRTNDSTGITTEGADKKGVEFAFDQATATLIKITAFSAISEEMMQDSAIIASYVNNQLALMVNQNAEKKITADLYTAATTTADGASIGGTLGYDAVLEAITDIRVAGAEPDAVLIHPNDWARFAIERQVAGTGAYFSGGPYAPPAQGLWGAVREVITPSATEGTPLVGAFRAAATLYTKGGTRVDASNSHDDYFQKNLVALRAERRLVVAVHYPEWLVEVDLGS